MLLLFKRVFTNCALIFTIRKSVEAFFLCIEKTLLNPFSLIFEIFIGSGFQKEITCHTSLIAFVITLSSQTKGSSIKAFFPYPFKQ
ncbi:hypothetical protein BH10BAC3_BH10BAC3_29740 [soil metagenome]